MAAHRVLGRVAVVVALVVGARAQQENDYTFVVMSDIHIGEGYARYMHCGPACVGCAPSH
jgi:hypothetical protein